MSESRWRKSTHSGGANSTCVEVTTWRKSTHSGGANQACVEVADASAVLVRDTTNREGFMLSVPAAAWSAFLVTIR